MKYFTAVLLLVSVSSVADPQVGGGRKTSDYLPVIRLGSSVPLGAGFQRVAASCTATWISDRHLLTAAHCVMMTIPIPYGYSFEVIKEFTANGVKLGRVKVHVNQNLTGADVMTMAAPPDLAAMGLTPPITPSASRHDMAIIELQTPPQVKPKTYAIHSTPLKKGDAVTMVGYGFGSLAYKWAFDRVKGIHTEIDFEKFGEGSGIKRYGYGKISSTALGYYTTNGSADPATTLGFEDRTAENTVILMGDSGGPLLIKKVYRDVSGKEAFTHEVAGVISSVQLKSKYSGEGTSMFPAVALKSNLNWINGILSARWDFKAEDERNAKKAALEKRVRDAIIAESLKAK